MVDTPASLAYIIWWHHALNSLSHGLARAAELQFAFNKGDRYGCEVCRAHVNYERLWRPGCGRSAL